jgi:hypothetical protein
VLKAAYCARADRVPQSAWESSPVPTLIRVRRLLLSTSVAAPKWNECRAIEPEPNLPYSRYTMRLGPHIQALPGNIGLFTRALAEEPVETLLYVPEQFSSWLHRPVRYEVEEEWGPPFHAMLGLPWPCPELDASDQMWARIHSELTAKGINVGRFTYAGVFSDADSALARATWCAVRHLRATRVVETGVARGVTTRMVLEAMAMNGEGRLWSVDLPYLFDKAPHDETGAAVPDDRREDWTYLKGSSRRRLRPLLAGLGQIDLFIHDSLHTVRNMRFEMQTAWPALRTGGVMFIDDVDKSAFREFVEKPTRGESMVCRSGDGPWMFGVVRRGPT